MYAVFVFNGRSQIKAQIKRKAYEDAGLQPPTDTTPKKAVTTQKHTPTEQPQPKKQRSSGKKRFYSKLLWTQT